MNEPILYQIRISQRAKHVSFRMSVHNGLEVVVPRGYNVSKIPQLVEKKRNWIESIERRFARHRRDFPPQPKEILPAEIALPAVNEIWKVEYHQKNSSSVILRQCGSDQLRLTGNTGSELSCKRALRRWLLRRGKEALLPWLRQTSEELNLPFSSASVRLQKSRWGSCSRHKTISVNARLLFLRPEVVRYLFIHELCHTVHMNHSISYWRFVASKEPDYKQLDKELRDVMRTLPGWVLY